MRELDLLELEMVSGGDSELRLGRVIVTGTRPTGGGRGGGLPPLGGDGFFGGDSGDEGGGGGGSDEERNQCHATEQDFSDGQIYAVRDVFRELPNVENVEYIAAITGSGANQDIAQDTIFTTNQGTQARIPDGTFTQSEVQQITGLIHNHPPGPFGNDRDDLRVNRYPSDADWQAAEQFVNFGADPASFSLFIIDPYGAVREFPYSDRAFYEGLGTAHMERGNPSSLPEPINDDNSFHQNALRNC